MFKKLSIEELRFLQNLYEVDWPKFVPTYGLLAHFIERFEKYPEWQEKVQFLTIDEYTLKDGVFLMIYCNYIVFFNSFELAPYGNLEKLLNSIDFSEEKKFWSFEVHHSVIIEKIIESQNLQKLYDETSKCTLHTFNEEEVKLSSEIFAEPPEGFYYDSLRENEVAKMTAISHYKMPSWYFENVIKYNITTGLYTTDGILVAWTAMHEVGETGMANVYANYRRQKLATGVIAKQGVKTFGAEKVIFGHIFDSNDAALQFFDTVGDAFHVNVIGSHRWINLRKNKFAMQPHL